MKEIIVLEFGEKKNLTTIDKGTFFVEKSIRKLWFCVKHKIPASGRN